MGGTGRGPEPEADFGKSTGEEDSDAKWVLGEREEVFRKKAVKGKVGADWQPARCADAFDCDEGEDLKAGMSPERVDDVDISLPLWERLERARDGTTKAGTANGARQKDTVDLVSRVKASLIGEEQSKKLEMQTWRDWDDGARQCSQAQEAPSFLGVELVVLEDSPGPQKPIVAHKSTQRAQPREATNTKVRDAESVCRGKLEGSVKQIHKNRIRLSTERVVIDLDP